MSSMKQTSNQPEPSYPNADSVVAVSPTDLLTDKRYFCKECLKGFPREQNLTLHGRIHNLPFNLKPKVAKRPGERKVYLCPEPTCQHHNRFRALGDFGGLKKHYLRKHSNQKNHKCDVCSKMYAAETDLKAHLKVCGKRKHICHCGARFARGNSFVAHKACCAIQAGHSPKLQIGESSTKMTTNSNNSHLIGTTTGENSMKSTSNDNPCSLIGLYAHSDPHIAALQNLSKSNLSATPDQSQLYPYIIDNGSLMTDPSMGSNLGQIFPDFINPSPIQQNQHTLHADLLMDERPLYNVNMGDGWHIFENGEGLSSNTINGVNLDQNEMPNHVFGEGSSAFNQELDGFYDQRSNFGNGDFNGQSNYGHGDWSRQSDYGMEVSNFETSVETAREVGPHEQILDQFRGFWF